MLFVMFALIIFTEIRLFAILHIRRHDLGLPGYISHIDNINDPDKSALPPVANHRALCNV